LSRLETLISNTISQRSVVSQSTNPKTSTTQTNPISSSSSTRETTTSVPTPVKQSTSESIGLESESSRSSVSHTSRYLVSSFVPDCSNELNDDVYNKTVEPSVSLIGYSDMITLAALPNGDFASRGIGGPSIVIFRNYRVGRLFLYDPYFITQRIAITGTISHLLTLSSGNLVGANIESIYGSMESNGRDSSKAN
jgi:hypothetical protein